MSHLFQELRPHSNYVDKRSGLTPEEWQQKLSVSKTVYVGNLSFYTTEEQIYELFSQCGDIDVLVMGLNRKKKNPCGFCFVRYFTHAMANRAVEFLNGIFFDERLIRVDWDSGEDIEKETRRYGRGISGMQWRDEFRQNYDPDRGGEGGGIDYNTFCAVRSTKRRRYQQDRHWDRYGYHGAKRRATTDGVVHPNRGPSTQPPPPPLPLLEVQSIKTAAS